MISENGKTLLEVRGLTRERRRHRDPQGHRSHGAQRRGARDHGAERLGQEHVREGARRPSAYEVTGGTVLFEGKNLLEIEPEERARAGVFLGFPVPGRDPRRREQRSSCASPTTRCRRSAARTSSTRSSSTTSCARR